MPRWPTAVKIDPPIWKIKDSCAPIFSRILFWLLCISALTVLRQVLTGYICGYNRVQGYTRNLQENRNSPTKLVGINAPPFSSWKGGGGGRKRKIYSSMPDRFACCVTWLWLVLGLGVWLVGLYNTLSLFSCEATDGAFWITSTSNTSKEEE